MNRRWMCTDVWLNILPFFDHAQLGLNLALLSFRFDVLVDKHFDGKSELTIWRRITIRKSIKPKPILFVDWKPLGFPLPKRPLPTKIRFNDLRIAYIDHSVITFLHANKQIWDSKGTKLDLNLFSPKTKDFHQIWGAFVRQIWPIFMTSIRHLSFAGRDCMDNLRRRISPTILADLDHLGSIDSGFLFPYGMADDGPNANAAGKALSKWLHTPRKDGQPKELCCAGVYSTKRIKWFDNHKQAFLRATTSVSYNIRIAFRVTITPIEQFELVNERTNEKLTLSKESDNLLLKRCPIGETAAAVQQQKDKKFDHLNTVFCICDAIGPLIPPGQSDEKLFSTPEPSDQRKKK